MLYKDYTSPSNSVTDTYAINNAIINILMTQRGSLPGKPQFGSDLYKIIFKPIDSVTKSIIKNYIVEALGEFEPRVFVKSTVIKEIPEYNKLVVTINYEYIDKGLNIESNLNLSIRK